MFLFITLIQFNFGFPLVLLTPSIYIILFFFTIAIVGFHCTCLNHLNRLSLILSFISIIPKLPQIDSFIILSFLILTLIYINIFISATHFVYIFGGCPTFCSIKHGWSYNCFIEFFLQF